MRKVRGLIAIYRGLKTEGERRGDGRARRSPGRRRKAEEGREAGGREAATGGASMSASAGEKKKKEKAGRCGRRKVGRGPAGLEREVRFLFFLFSFKTLFKFKPFNSKPFKTFQTFLQNFINF
jgi:hypothetical protein